jgi:hypothetical protein
MGPNNVAAIALPKVAFPLATTLPATYAGIETKIHTIINTTAISSKVSRSIPFENRDASAEIILGLFSAVSYNISVQLIVRFRIAQALGSVQ